MDKLTNERQDIKHNSPWQEKIIRVLLVEDNEINTFVARGIMETQGLLVDHAENGKDAVELFESHQERYYDVIIMDVHMPIMNGIEATKTLRALEREDARNVPIIAMTANDCEEDIGAVLEAGMNAHLAKPIEPRLLLDTLRRYVG